MHYTITRVSVQRHAAELLRTCLCLKDHSPTCTAMVLLHVLFTACSRLCSLSAACWSLATAPSRETIRQAPVTCGSTRGPAPVISDARTPVVTAQLLSVGPHACSRNAAAVVGRLTSASS